MQLCCSRDISGDTIGLGVQTIRPQCDYCVTAVSAAVYRVLYGVYRTPFWTEFQSSRVSVGAEGGGVGDDLASRSERNRVVWYRNHASSRSDRALIVGPGGAVYTVPYDSGPTLRLQTFAGSWIELVWTPFLQPLPW